MLVSEPSVVLELSVELEPLGAELDSRDSLVPVEVSTRESVDALVEPYVEPIEAGEVLLAIRVDAFSLFERPLAPDTEAAPAVEVLLVVLESASFELAAVVGLLGVGEGSLELAKIEVLGDGEFVSLSA